MKLKTLFESEHTSEVIVDDDLFRVALNDTKNAKGRWISSIESDAHLVVVGGDRSLDMDVKMGFYTLDDVSQDWSRTREFIKKRHGDPVILFRADLPAHKHNPGALTLYYADKKMASRFMSKERELIKKSVKVDDIVAVFAHKSGYYEFIVKIV